MSVESEILRIQHNVANTYAAVADKGGSVPLQPNSENLAAAVASIPTGTGDTSYLVKAPVGTIVIWSGTAENIPTGWQLCDGTNNTPDLRDKFVLGAGEGHAAGSSGGEENHKLSISEMPSHSHNEMIGVVNYSSVRNHVTHTLSGSVGGVEFQSPDSGSIFNSRTAGAVTTSSSGGNQPHNNMPPYYTLCYIMKMTPDETDGGVAFTTDSTLTMSDDSVLGVTTPVNTILTQTEYDALPEAQRNKGMYVIPEEGDSGGSSGGGATNDVYSTEETRIGTWINGKPLYRRVFTANLIENSNIVLLTPEECSIIESMPLTRGSVMYNGKTMYLPYYLVESTTTEITKINAYCDVTFAPQRRGLLISTMGSFLSSTDIIANVIIEYTKTTD